MGQIRFSFYGLKAILELYFVNNLHLTDNQATLTMHTFVFFAYFFSVPGGFVSDTFIGIFIFSSFLKSIRYLSSKQGNTIRFSTSPWSTV